MARENSQSPVVKQDLIDLEGRFLSHVAEMETRLLAQSADMETRLLSHSADMETRLLSHSADMETRFVSHSADMETRLTSYVDKRNEKVETSLLTAFHGWARSMEIRTRVTGSNVSSLDERLALAEERIAELERRK